MGQIKGYKNAILNSRFDANNSYPIMQGGEYFDNNYAHTYTSETRILTNYYHNSPLFYRGEDTYTTFANRTFHSINSPYDILPFGHELQPRLLKMFGAGSKFGLTINNTNYLKTITNTTSFYPSDNQSWVKYGTEQLVEIPSWATKIRYGVKYLMKNDDPPRAESFGGLCLHFVDPSLLYNSYVNINMIKSSNGTTFLSDLQSLYGINQFVQSNYVNFDADLGSNAMCQWLGPLTSKVKVRRRSSIFVTSLDDIGIPFTYIAKRDIFNKISDTVDIPTFSTSNGDQTNGKARYASLQMFFAEWLGYFVDSGPNPTQSGSIYFYEPFIYFE